jgi:hypothetical protein
MRRVAGLRRVTTIPPLVVHIVEMVDQLVCDRVLGLDHPRQAQDLADEDFVGACQIVVLLL